MPTSYRTWFEIPSGSAARKIAEVGKEKVCTSVIVAADLRRSRKTRLCSAHRAGRQDSRRVGNSAFRRTVQYDLRVYSSRLEREGQPIGANDLLISAHALSLAKMVVTNKEKEFTRVVGLKTENWLRDGWPFTQHSKTLPASPCSSNK
jgi:tRNA(fMet)-specific endonuclease VapC